MSKMKNCKTCGKSIAKNAKNCPFCGAKNKSSIFTKWWFWALIVIVVIVAVSNTGNSDDNEWNKVDTAATTATTSTTETSSSESPDTSVEASSDSTVSSQDKIPEKTEYHVGDILEDGNTKIVYIASGDYNEENSFLVPAEGNKYIFFKFAFENLSSNKDTSVSFLNFECFADGYATEMYYSGDEELSATLSAGRATTGYVYFEVPSDASIIELEYETNILTGNKIKFIFDGNKDSGYVQQPDTTPTEGAYTVGDIIESSKLKVTYLSCEEYISDNMFIEPAEGHHFISCEFEFENIGNSDEFISSADFDCYADGFNCNGTFIRDDDLSATLSAGRKTKGTVTFEVPLDATVVEIEYLSNYWTSNRVVFKAY